MNYQEGDNIYYEEADGCTTIDVVEEVEETNSHYWVWTKYGRTFKFKK
jgi:hypothetical protein